MKLMGKGPVVEFPQRFQEDEDGADKANQHLLVPMNRSVHSPGFPAQMPVKILHHRSIFYILR